MELASSFEKEMRGMLVDKTSPGLGALIGLLQKSEDAAEKAKRQLLHGGFHSISEEHLGRPLLQRERQFVPCLRTNLVVDFLQRAACRGHGGIGS